MDTQTDKILAIKEIRFIIDELKSIDEIKCLINYPNHKATYHLIQRLILCLEEACDV